MPIKLTKENSEKYTGLPFIEIIKLTGILGIHPLRDLYRLATHFLATYHDRTVEVEIITPYIKQLIVRIDFRNKTIYNQAIESNRRIKYNKNVGLSLLSSQVEAAQHRKFLMIWLNAWGNFKERKKFIGYITWGKLGYIMSHDNQIDFLKKMADLGRKEVSIYELLSTKEGEQIWEVHGEEWYGEFDLRKNSESLEILKKEQDRKYIFTYKL